MRRLNETGSLEALPELIIVPEAIRKMREWRDAVLPPFVRQLTALKAELSEPLAEFAHRIDALKTSIGDHLPEILEFARLIRDAQQWLEDAPEKLKAAFHAAGLVPHPQLALAALRALTDEFERNGAAAAVSHLRELHEELLASETFRTELQVRWEHAERWRVFSDVLTAFDAGLYAVVIPAALAQTDGIVADFFSIADLRQKALREKVAELHAENEYDIHGPLVTAVLDDLFGGFKHGSAMPSLNRNAVLHGADRSYGTRENAVTAILWADYLLSLSQREADAGAPAGP